ncbi:MAG TPA: O-methyltransferase [Bryobacteraceae bacterium]|jgi:predicted O-methyltransferase YrrM|nr:O-methyltransferase [Bryobacteraceae bacterium]
MNDAPEAKDKWTAVDKYFEGLLAPADRVFEEALAANAAAGLPKIDVSPMQGKLLQLLAQLQGARKILEIGTLGGYSTIWLGRALAPGGRLITLEADAKHAEVARENIRRAGLADVVDLRVGRALDALPLLAAEKEGPFDLVFVDADKANNPAYLEWALKLSRVGSLIIVDNVVREGAVIEADNQEPDVRGTRRFFELVGAEPRLSATAIQTVGNKGYDGFAMALVVS